MPLLEEQDEPTRLALPAFPDEMLSSARVFGTGPRTEPNESA